MSPHSHSVLSAAAAAAAARNMLVSRAGNCLALVCAERARQMHISLFFCKAGAKAADSALRAAGTVYGALSRRPYVRGARRVAGR